MTDRNRSSQQRAHTFSRTGWADAQPGQGAPGLADPALLAFSARPDVRPAQRKSPSTNLGWWALCVIGVAGFALLVNAMLARSADTAGVSPIVSVTPRPEFSASMPPEIVDEPTVTTRPTVPLVYKCVGAQRAVSYQSFPCDTRQSMAQIYEASPDTASDVAWARQQQRKAARDAAALSRMAKTDGSATSWYGTSGIEDGRRAQCDRAKANREATLAQVGLARTFDLLRQLDEDVREACKGL